MKLDLFRNELVFSGIFKPHEFSKKLQEAKGIKFRVHNNHYYIPLTHFEVTRRVLKDYKGNIHFSVNYELFAERFVTNKKQVTINWRPHMCEIEGAGIPFDLIIPQTQYFNKAAINSQSYKKGQWDGTVQLFDTKKGEFPSGLLERITKALSERGVPYTINQLFDYPKPSLDLVPSFSFTPTEDQESAVRALESANNGVAKLPTGFGKTSFVAAALIARKGVKSMFLANQRVLINDARKDFEEVFAGNDVKIGTIGDGEFAPGDITVASIQGIVAALSPPTPLEKTQIKNEIASLKEWVRQQPDKEEFQKNLLKAEKKLIRFNEKTERTRLINLFLKDVELFIVDEAQVLGTDMWNKFLRACPAPYRYTLSATPTRTDGGGVQIIAATGEMRYESSASEQIEKGRLSEFRGHFQKFDHGLNKDILRELSMDYHEAYRLFIVENEARNQYLCDWLIKWAKEGYSVLGLVTRREHGEIIQAILMDMGMPDNTFAYVDGQTAKKKRNDTIEAFRRSEFPILIGTSIFDVGFNAKNASKIVRFNAGGSEVREPQRAGRTVRMRDDGSWGESIDIIDENAPFFETQGWKRYRFLREEFGAHRVSINKGTIEAPFNISRLEEVAAEIPDETDRKAAAEVIAKLSAARDIQEVTEAPDEYQDLTKDRDLVAMLDELTFKGDI